MSNSLADELLADVAEGESNAMDNDKEQYSSILYNGESSHAGPDESVRADTSMQYVDESHAHGASQPGNELESLQNNDASNTNIRSISKLYENDTLSELLKVRSIDSHKVIEQRKAQPPTVITGALEGSEEYFLIIRANNTALEIDHEMLALYKVRSQTLTLVHSRTLRSAISRARNTCIESLGIYSGSPYFGE
jgi:hypothetical protein